jgi:ribonuclease HII
MEHEGKLVLGIDDAGRGPVIGPMLLAGSLLTLETEQELKELGITDSKLLTKKKRQAMVEIIKEKSIAWHAESTTPAEIDTGLGIGLNLNQVEALKASLIIKELLKSVNEFQLPNLTIIIDCPSVNTESWKRSLEEFLQKENIDTTTLNIDCKHKADLLHPVVSAASIIAKTTRDSAIEDLKKQLNIECGSGYPSDPKTKQFLIANINNKEILKARIFRESWQTFRDAKDGKSQSKLPDY